MNRRRMAVRSWLIILATVASHGCGSSEHLTPVSGRVLVNGMPATGAAVVFHPIEERGDSTRPLGQVDASGEFRLTTARSGDGAAPGEYRVTLTWYVSTATKRSREGDADSVLNLIPDKYARAETTPLTATVTASGGTPTIIEIVSPIRRR